MTKFLLHTTRYLTNNQSLNQFDKVISVPLTQDVNTTIDFLQKENSNCQIYVSEDLIDFISNKKNVKTLKLQENTLTPIPRPKVVFYAQSDTLAHTTTNIITEIGSEIDYLIFTPIYNDENSSAFFKKQNLSSKPFSIRLLKEFSPDYILLFNDWTKEAKRILSICKSIGIRNICLQESIIDFGSKERMQYCDNVFMQGIQSIMDAPRKTFFLTGNPRYKKQNTNYPNCKALINCNFTYGIFENWRDRWLDTIVDILSTKHIDFNISQHPRDTGDLSRYSKHIISSSSSSINQQIADSSFVITRFSSLIHESLLQYRAVIYYNPHGEKLKYNFQFNDNFLFYASTKEELSIAISKITNTTKETIIKSIDNYLQCHCLPKTNKATDFILQILKSNTLILEKESIFDKFINRIIFSPKIMSPYLRLKKRLLG